MLSQKIKLEIFSWVKVIAFAFLFSGLLLRFVIVNASVPTGSMQDTIGERSRVVAFRLSYVFSEPERYDIVVFRFPDDESLLYVKRIIGLPGETVDIINGKVYINGSSEPLNDEFVKGTPFLFNYGPYVVPEGCYFMMGDNRNNSADSRDWRNKFVNRDKILGEVKFCYFPELKWYSNKYN